MSSDSDCCNNSSDNDNDGYNDNYHSSSESDSKSEIEKKSSESESDMSKIERFRIAVAKNENRDRHNTNIGILVRFFNKKIPDLYKKFYRWNSIDKIIKEPYYNNNYYSKFLKTCYFCKELKCNPFNFTTFLNKYIKPITDNDIDFNMEHLTCNLCFSRREYHLDLKYLKVKRNDFIKCCCGITYRNVYKDEYKVVGDPNSNYHKNVNDSHCRKPFHQLYVKEKETINKINEKYQINLLNTNLRKLQSFVKNNIEFASVVVYCQKVEGINKQFKKIELLNNIINKLKAEKFIINDTNIYDLNIENLFKFIKDNKIMIKQVSKYSKASLLKKIIEVYTTEPKVFMVFDTNIYSLKIVDLKAFIRNNNIPIIKVNSYKKEKLINKIIEIYS